MYQEKKKRLQSPVTEEELCKLLLWFDLVESAAVLRQRWRTAREDYVISVMSNQHFTPNLR